MAHKPIPIPNEEKINMPEYIDVPIDTSAVIKVIGVGGGGISAVNHMVASNLQGVTFTTMDTNAQTLADPQAGQAIQLGTPKRKYGVQPKRGRKGAEESLPAIKATIGNANLVFVVAGMGGGTGSSAAPVIALAAKEAGALTIGVVTKPFYFEGKRRLEIAEVGIQELLNDVDSLIIIPCDRLIQLASKKAAFADMQKIADEALHRAVRSISDILVHQSLVAVDFADLQTIFKGKGKAAMGFGAASGNSRAHDAASQAVCSPLLEGVPLDDADGVWCNITSNEDITIEEVDEAVGIIQEQAHEDAMIFLGTRFDITWSINVFNYAA
jgi:cell division protein FtsZ